MNDLISTRVNQARALLLQARDSKDAKKVADSLDAAISILLPIAMEAKGIASRTKTTSEPKLVYVIESNGLLKIGVSKSPQERLKSIRTGHPSARLIASFPGGFELEGKLHKRFCANNIGGEWFVPSQRIENIVRSLSLI